ncbi:MAG TPA: hypothetical protein VEQ60_03350 [Longimicrobium sp.]|nr:hypothetical protein [Longimicrobium sp.]
MARQIQRNASRGILSLLALACAAACAPMVTHGPRVQPGVAVVVTAGGGLPACDSAVCELGLLPQAALGLRGGRTATETRPGFSVAANFSINLFSSELDLYAQAPTGSMGLDAGAGVLLSAAHTMPYVQLGRTRDDGSGFYTTQGFVWMMQRPATYRFFGEDDSADELQPRYWAPTVAYRTAGRRGLHLYVSGAFGTADEYGWTGEGTRKDWVGSQPVRTVMAGAVFEGSPLDLLPWFLIPNQ